MPRIVKQMIYIVSWNWNDNLTILEMIDQKKAISDDVSKISDKWSVLSYEKMESCVTMSVVNDPLEDGFAIFTEALTSERHLSWMVLSDKAKCTSMMTWVMVMKL